MAKPLAGRSGRVVIQVEEEYTLKEKKFMALDNLRAVMQCYINLTRDNALVSPGIGNGLCKYEDKIRKQFAELCDLLGVDKRQVGFPEVVGGD